jgi:magnesium transporter
MLKLYEKLNLIRKLQGRDIHVIRGITNSLPAQDLAVLLDTPSKIDLKKIFGLIPPKKALLTVKYLHLDTKLSLLKSLPLKQTMEILNRMSPDDRTAFFEYIPKSDLKTWLNLLSNKEREIADSLLSYPENSIGRLMTPQFITVKASWSVTQVLAHIRKLGQDIEILDSIYVTDEKGVLIDDLKIKNILLSPVYQKVSDLMDHQFDSLNANDDQVEALKVFKSTRRSVLPVTGPDGKPLGIITMDDLLHLMDKKTTEDIHRIGGSEFFPEQYFKIPLLKMLKKRAGWLVLLFIGEMFTATAMGVFENQIARAVVLALFVPLIISSGGNSGSQSATIIIRALALEEVHLSDWFRVMRREISTGFLLGCTLGLIGIIRISAWTMFSNVYGPHWFIVALTVGISLVGIVLWGTLAGSLLPFVLRRLGFDPAVSSAPLVATLVDVTGLVIYFSTAYLIMKGTLL